MLNDGKAFKKIYLATGYTDLRRGIEGLAGIIRFQFELDPYDRNTLFLFCGRRCDRIKALLWEGDDFLLMYKRLDNGAFNWPRSKAEAVTISEDPFQMLMQGLEIIAKHPISEMADPPKSNVTFMQFADFKSACNPMLLSIRQNFMLLSTDSHGVCEPSLSVSIK
ncbi:IS66 family insertion sequence element accessory protein TnpB [Enterocloster bolteae]|uniref:IS66 family insertion sequence element accessory protein TnpB n=1 Tax=Enterocloster bolteae TaxID=208479 RepID=UPI00210E6295|nr:IS66 family insertion sequence element accessory protein TnpB [Enterocloster bolteae]MCQ5146264.1 IS66 family insertion sequence element accessory protein TnpB [Enterocloster bolteae]